MIKVKICSLLDTIEDVKEKLTDSEYKSMLEDLKFVYDKTCKNINTRERDYSNSSYNSQSLSGAQGPTGAIGPQNNNSSSDYESDGEISSDYNSDSYINYNSYIESDSDNDSYNEIEYPPLPSQNRINIYREQPERPTYGPDSLRYEGPASLLPYNSTDDNNDMYESTSYERSE